MPTSPSLLSSTARGFYPTSIPMATQALENVTDENVTSASSNVTIGSQYTCNMDTYTVLSLVVYPMAVIVILVLTLLTNKKKCVCCIKGSRPNCIYPLNMLDGYKDRFGNACIFGALTVQLIDVLLGGTTLSGALPILGLAKFFVYPLATPLIKAIILILNVGIITLSFYPLFACLSTNYRFIGAIMGTMCSLYRLGFCMWTMAACQLQEQYFGKYTLVKYNTAFYNFPSMLFLMGLTAKYIYVMIICIKKRSFGVYNRRQVLAENHHILHVHRLFGKAPMPWHEDDLSAVSIFNPQKLKATLFYHITPYFRFPTRLVATFVILISATYQVGLLVIFPVWSWLRRLQRATSNAAELASIVGETVASFLQDLVAPLGRWLEMLNNMWIAVTCITIGVAIFYVYHASICYKKHIYRLYRGDRSMFPNSWVRQANQNIMTNAVRYAGLQVAYFMWGFVLIQIVLSILFFIIMFVIFVPAVEFQYFEILIFIAEILVIPTLISMAIYYSQVLLTRFVFLQHKINEPDTVVPLAVNNRNVFYNVSLFYFFWNVFLGIVSAIMRILKGMLFGIFFIPRIDRSVMMRGYESMDAGFMCYLSVLSVINAHDHPVMRVYLKLLWDGAMERRSGKNLVAPSRTSRKARQNWHLAYTLLNNPDIIRYRKTNIKLEDVDHMARHRIVVAERKKMEGIRTAGLFDHATAFEISVKEVLPQKTAQTRQQQQQTELEPSSPLLQAASYEPMSYGTPC